MPFHSIAYDPVTQVLYGGLHRGVWASALAWVVLTCHFGYGGEGEGTLSREDSRIKNIR